MKKIRALFKAHKQGDLVEFVWERTNYPIYDILQPILISPQPNTNNNLTSKIVMENLSLPNFILR